MFWIHGFQLLWPFSTLGWPERSPDLDYYLPTNVLVTESGIIYLWVARMIMSTLEFTVNPFDTVLIHGKVWMKMELK